MSNFNEFKLYQMIPLEEVNSGKMRYIKRNTGHVARFLDDSSDKEILMWLEVFGVITQEQITDMTVDGDESVILVYDKTNYMQPICELHRIGEVVLI